jgi:hypothetical protein
VLGDPGIDVDELVALLVELLALPEVTEPEPEHSVLVTHCDVAFVRAAARLQGPLRVLAVDEGTTLVGHTTDTCDVTSAAAAISASEPRRDRTLVLWTRGQTLSLCVLRRGSPVGEWTWEETWSSTGAGRAAQPAELLAQIEAFAAGAADVPRVRRLLAQQEAPSPGELVSALALPPQVIDALGHDGLAVVPGSVLVGPATARAALLGSALDAWSHPRPVARRHRLLYALYTCATIAMTAATLGMTALSWAVIATGGEVVDQAGVTGEDWLYSLLVTVLALVLVPTSVHRSRRLRRRDRGRRMPSLRLGAGGLSGRAGEDLSEEDDGPEQERQDVHCGAPQADRVDAVELGPHEVERHAEPDRDPAEARPVERALRPAPRARPAEDDQHDEEEEAEQRHGHPQEGAPG